jgi:hypothetical protein
MGALMCKYCGKEVKSLGGRLLTSRGELCSTSPTKKHILISNFPYCIYCGQVTKIQGDILVTSYGKTCNSSPNKRHILQI